MWQVINRTPFAAAGYFLRDKAGFEHWVVAVRGRFELRPDELPRIVEQPPVRLTPEYADDEAKELAAESDLAPFRPKPDVLLRGNVQPPVEGGHACLLTLRLGTLEKTLQAFGPRHVRRQRGKWLVERRPFEPFALSWTRSLGGQDVIAASDPAAEAHPANPLGTGWSRELAKAPDGAEFHLPQLERPGQLMHPARPLPEPAGFGAIQPGWQPRLQRAGTYDDAWRAERAPLPPENFSEAFHQAAPDDQVYPTELRGGETGEVDGLHPDGALAFRLPQIVLDGRTRIGMGVTDTRFRIVGVDIDATSGLLDMVWNIAVPCPDGDHLVERTTVLLRQMAGVER